MKIVGVIPARFGASRFPGKPLFEIAGKPLLQWVIEGARQSRRLQEVLVATDDARIAGLARRCGVEAVMTDSDLPSGTDRIWAAVKSRDVDVVVNVQGDEPLITGEVVDRLADVFLRPWNSVEMATLGHAISTEELGSFNAVKVVVNRQGEALYFSRFPIPYSRHDAESLGSLAGCLKHIGLYAYTKNFLEKFCEAPPALIEKAESLEQLRALDLGARIHVVKVEHSLRGVDTPEDAAALEPILRRIHGS
ncbi:MAG: 3-deoxy-manno-octulosonate cytidylyltransferase [Bdellovibrionaceae bacterium]|nr:3-deoxy-manno-octulosonate cytidylyltransferase [Pseudobdellovibrionaceae bacterium]